MTNTFTIGLLATAVSASLAMANGGEEEKNKFQDKSPVSFKAGSGITFDGGDNFSLNLKNRLQIQFSHSFGEGIGVTEAEDPADGTPGFVANNDIDNNRTNFDIRRARTTLSGHAFNKNLQYMLNLDWVDGDSLSENDDGDPVLSSNSVVKDAWVHWNFVHNDSGKVGLRIGQSKTYYGLEGTGSSAGLYFIERSDAAEFFSNARSRGAWLHGSHMESKFRWTAGGQNNGVAGDLDASEEGDNTDNELVYVFSANFDPMGDFVGGGSSYEKYMQGDLDGAAELKGTLGVGYAMDNREEGSESTNYNLNTAWKVSNFWAQAEYFGRTDDTGETEFDHDGVTVAVGYTLPKSGDSNMQWGLGARWSSRNPDEAVSNSFAFTEGSTAVDEVEELTIGLNAFYHGHNCKTQLNYVNTDDKTTDQDAQAIVIQFQIII